MIRYFIIAFILFHPNLSFSQDLDEDLNKSKYDNCVLENIGSAHTNLATLTVKQICRDRFPQILRRSQLEPWVPKSAEFDGNMFPDGAETWYIRQTVKEWRVDDQDLIALVNKDPISRTGAILYAWAQKGNFCRGTLPHYSISEYLGPNEYFKNAEEILAKNPIIDDIFKEERGPYEVVFPNRGALVSLGYCFALFEMMFTMPPESDAALELAEEAAQKERKKQYEASNGLSCKTITNGWDHVLYGDQRIVDGVVKGKTKIICK